MQGQGVIICKRDYFELISERTKRDSYDDYDDYDEYGPINAYDDNDYENDYEYETKDPLPINVASGQVPLYDLDVEDSPADIEYSEPIEPAPEIATEYDGQTAPVYMEYSETLEPASEISSESNEESSSEESDSFETISEADKDDSEEEQLMGRSLRDEPKMKTMMASPAPFEDDDDDDDEDDEDKPYIPQGRTISSSPKEDKEKKFTAEGLPEDCGHTSINKHDAPMLQLAKRIVGGKISEPGKKCNF